MSNAIVVYGAGGHGKVLAEMLATGGRTVEAFIDDNPSLRGSSVFGLPVYLADEWLRAHPGTHVALGVGENLAREHVATRVRHSGCRILTVIHPAAIVARSARIGEGTAIMPGAVVNPDSEIGEASSIPARS